MAKLNLNNIDAGYAANTALNTNFDLIETALENTLSRDGTTPNTMSADLDMNGYRILNALAQSGEGFIWKGAWVTATTYSQNNLVVQAGTTYIAISDHTSGTFSTDFLDGKWEVVAAVGASGPGSGDMLVANNLSELMATAAAARSNIGAQALDPTLTALAALNTNVGLIEQTGTDTFTKHDMIGDLLSIGVSAPALTHSGGKDSFTVRYGSETPNSIYNAVFPSVAHFDSLNGVVQIASGSNIEHAAGISGYVINNDISPANGVGIFGCGIAAVDSSHVWGINTLLQDAPTRAAGTGTGRYLVNELDFNVMNPATTVIGCSVGGNSLAQPVLADGFVVNVLGTGFKWVTAFNSQDAAADNAFNAGMVALSGASVASQKILWQYTTSASVKQSAHIQVEGGGYMAFGGSSPLQGFSFQGADIFLDTGKGYRVGGNVVVSDRRTGYTAAMTGTANRATAYDTSTITLVQLAERVKALQDDLTSHGMIGV